LYRYRRFYPLVARSYHSTPRLHRRHAIEIASKCFAIQLLIHATRSLALHDAGHVVSVVNPAQIRDFGRTKLGRNKTDKVDAALIREYAELFKPGPWTPPSPAMRTLNELQTVRASIVGSRTEWKNRIGSGLGDSTATKLAAATIEHFTIQLQAIDKAISETIDGDAELRGRRDLLLSVTGVGETLAALLLAEMPEPGVLRRSGEVVAYAGLKPSHHRSGTSIDRPTRISKIGNAAQAARCGGHAQALGHLLRSAEDRPAVRPGHRYAGLNLGDIPIPLFDWKPVIPPSRSDARQVGARSEGQGGLQARAQQRALSLTAVSTPAPSARWTEGKSAA